MSFNRKTITKNMRAKLAWYIHAAFHYLSFSICSRTRKRVCICIHTCVSSIVYATHTCLRPYAVYIVYIEVVLHVICTHVKLPSIRQDQLVFRACVCVYSIYMHYYVEYISFHCCLSKNIIYFAV